MLCPAGSWLGDSSSPLSQRYLSTCPVAHGVSGDSRGEVQDEDLTSAWMWNEVGLGRKILPEWLTCFHRVKQGS